MEAKVQTELSMKIGSNKEGMTVKDLNTLAFDIEQMANEELSDIRVHIGAKDDYGLTEEEMSVVLESARYCLGAVFTEFAEEADLEDSYLLGIREKLEEVTGGVG